MKVMIHIGLDVHNDSIAISLAPTDSTEVRRWGLIGGTHDDVLRFIKKLQAAHPDATLKFCYEAGPRGYPARPGGLVAKDCAAVMKTRSNCVAAARVRDGVITRQ